MDEESAPFKAGYNLAYNLGLRVYLEPEYCHPAWNNLKAAIRQSGLQPTFLKATLMSHVNHSPYGSGANMHLKREVCEHLIQTMTMDEFQRLCEDIAWDRGLDPDDELLPQSPDDLLAEPTIAKRGIFDARHQECQKQTLKTAPRIRPCVESKGFGLFIYIYISIYNIYICI